MVYRIDIQTREQRLGNHDSYKLDYVVEDRYWNMLFNGLFSFFFNMANHSGYVPYSRNAVTG